MLANHDQNNVQSCVRLAQSMGFNVKLESSFYAELLLTFCQTRSIENQTRSIENRADRFFCRKFQLSPSPFNVQGFMFCPKYIRENPSHVFRVLFCCVCESHCEIQRCLPSHTLRVSKLQIHVKRLVIIQLQNIRASRYTSRCACVLLRIQGKKESVVSKLSRGRGSKFPTGRQQQDVSGLSLIV